MLLPLPTMAPPTQQPTLQGLRPRAGHGQAGSRRRGFTIAELAIVIVIIGMMTYTVSVSFEAMVPGERLNSSVRSIAATLREARREATTRNKDFYLLYDLDEHRYRLVTPFLKGGGLFIPGFHAEDDRYRTAWQPLKEGVEFDRVVLSGEMYEVGQVLVRFDPSGSASEHYVVLSQPRYENLFTVEASALTGEIRFHSGLYERPRPEDADFQ